MNYSIEYNTFNFGYIKDTGLDEELILSLVKDDNTLEDIKEELENHPNLIQVGIDGEFVGFFSIDDRGSPLGRASVEVHAYIRRKYRHISKELLKHFRMFLFEVTNYECILTSTHSDIPHVERLLKMIGFKELYKDEQGSYYKNGVPCYRTYYYYVKGE